MRVLVVSHNSFSETSNMGKTLLSYMGDFQPEDVAQFYIHSEVPTNDTVCHNYYRFTDKDAIRSLLPFRQQGQIFTREDIQTQRDFARTDSGLVSAVYQIGQKRTAAIYALRNLLWRLGRWNTQKLRQWVQNFDPDVIFFASGDYGFMYRIALAIADMVKKPLVVSCVDDYYLHNRNQNSLIGPMVHKAYMKAVHKTMDRASAIVTICDGMRQEYRQLFGKPCHVLHTSAVPRDLALDPDANRISYIGNLDFNRHLQLVQLGRALKELPEAEGRLLDVYSMEQRSEILSHLTEENGIRFHGPIPADQVLQVMAQSMAVIHTESFDPHNRELVRFSVSTKIPESLMYGPCLLAYGPRGVASMDYLAEHNAAFVINSPEELKERLSHFLTDREGRAEILANARALAKANHHGPTNAANVRRWLREACEYTEVRP